MKATGQLQHHFWGDYSCTIALEFASGDCAEAVLQLLPGWKQSKDNPALIGAFLTNEQLTAFQAKIGNWNLQIQPCGRRDCRHQCQNAGIDSVNHSIDYGPVFTVDVPAEDINQSYLPLCTSISA